MLALPREGDALTIPTPLPAVAPVGLALGVWGEADDDWFAAPVEYAADLAAGRRIRPPWWARRGLWRGVGGVVLAATAVRSMDDGSPAWEVAVQVAARWAEGDGGPGRNVDTLTGAGREALAEQGRAWNAFRGAFDALLDPTPAA